MSHVRRITRWCGLALTIGAATGIAAGLGAAFFLAALSAVTHFRQRHEALVYLLPVAGGLLGIARVRAGAAASGGSRLILDAHARLGAPLPLRMALLAVLGTVTTHAFGGSAGREGAAVQMGASLADPIARALRTPAAVRRHWLRAGVAAGFGAVFGTPAAGTLFALEFFGGRAVWASGVPAALGACVGDQVARALGARHLAWATPGPLPLDAWLLPRGVALAAALAALGLAFLWAVQAVSAAGRWAFAALPMRMAAGGLAVVALWHTSGASAALGLGTETIALAVGGHAVGWGLLAQKGALTALTVGSGYVGGEVTPLFFLGAGLGSALARPLGLPPDMAAAVGMAALFAAVARAPLALSMLAWELFGWHAGWPTLFVATVAASLLGGRRLYAGQAEHPLWGRRASALPSR